MTYNNWSRCFAIAGLMLCSARPSPGQVGQTEITEWQYGKNGAVSLTYDDGSINQFRVAVPIMDSFGFPATFFIITGQIPGSQYHGTFIGKRPRRQHAAAQSGGVAMCTWRCVDTKALPKLRWGASWPFACTGCGGMDVRTLRR
jgi:hypothetical protein